MNRKVIVTGADGFIGSYALNALYEEGYSVTAVHKKLGSHDKNSQWDIMEVNLLKDNADEHLAAINPAVIVHCAAILPKQFQGEEVEQITKANLAIDLRIINFCFNKVCRLIYISGTSVYGMGNNSILSEESKVNPIGPYVAGKFESEMLILDKLNYNPVILRISAPYGPRQRSKTVLRVFIEQAIANLDLMYYGTGDREQDFTSIYDVAKAIVCAVSNKNIHGIFNIASGKPISMRNLAELVIRTIPGTKSKVIAPGQPDPQENYRARFDISKAKKILGWQPTVSLEEGIRHWAEKLKEQR